MNILMLGSDDSIFTSAKEDNQTILRLSRYLNNIKELNPSSSIIDVVNTRFPSKSFSPIDGLTIIPIQSKFIQWYPWKGFQYVEKNLNNSKFDLITCQNPFEVGLLGLLLKRKYKIPLEVQIHLNYFSPYWTKEHILYNRIRTYIAKLVIRNADKIRVVSSSIQEALISRWGLPDSRIYVAPVPVFIKESLFEKNKLSALDKPEKKVILFIGRLSYQKNLPGLFKICQKILMLFNDVEIFIIGDGPLRSYAENNARVIDPKRIHILGELPNSSLSNWYEKADIFLLPSFYEGLPRVLIESYLFKVPAIGSNCAGLQDIILNDQTGFIVDVEAIDSFTDKISWILNHPEEKKEMGIKGFEYVRSRFDPYILSQKIISEWKLLVNNDEIDHDHSPNNIR